MFDRPAFTFDDTRFAHPEPRIAIDGLWDDRLMAVTRIEMATGRRTLSTRIGE